MSDLRVLLRDAAARMPRVVGFVVDCEGGQVRVEAEEEGGHLSFGLDDHSPASGHREWFLDLTYEVVSFERVVARLGVAPLVVRAVATPTFWQAYELRVGDETVVQSWWVRHPEWTSERLLIPGLGREAQAADGVPPCRPRLAERHEVRRDPHLLDAHEAIRRCCGRLAGLSELWAWHGDADLHVSLTSERVTLSPPVVDGVRPDPIEVGFDELGGDEGAARFLTGIGVAPLVLRGVGDEESGPGPYELRLGSWVVKREGEPPKEWPLEAELIPGRSPGECPSDVPRTQRGSR